MSKRRTSTGSDSASGSPMPGNGQPTRVGSMRCPRLWSARQIARRTSRGLSMIVQQFVRRSSPYSHARVLTDEEFDERLRRIANKREVRRPGQGDRDQADRRVAGRWLRRYRLFERTIRALDRPRCDPRVHVQYRSDRTDRRAEGRALVDAVDLRRERLGCRSGLFPRNRAHHRSHRRVVSTLETAGHYRPPMPVPEFVFRCSCRAL
jgi:hypothetical protein